MFSRFVKVFSLLVIFVLLANVSGPATAETPPTDQPVPTIYPPGYHQPVGTVSQRMPKPANMLPERDRGDGKVFAQAAVTGKPGTVFAYSKTIGETSTPYFADFEHTYAPNALAFSDKGELYLLEEGGARLIKFDTFSSWSANKTPLWSAGKAGVHDWGSTGLNYPRDAAVATDGNSVWVADNDVATQFDADTGEMIQHFPPEPWNVQEEEYRFGDLRGVGFDSAGHLYLSDFKKQQIEIFRLVDNTPFYESTIYGFNTPGQMVFDGEDNLYVTDVFDYTIKKCEPDKTGGWPWSWECGVFFGEPGVQGNSADNTHLNMAFGLGYNRTHNVLYIADGGSGNLLRCTTGEPPSCQAIDQGLGWPSDVAVDPTDSTLTMSDYNWNGVYRFFGEDNLPPDKFTGDPRMPWLANEPDHTPYLTDDNHYNAPTGVEVDLAGNLYVVEESGQRMTKLDKNGTVIWKTGTPGVSSWDDTSKLDYPRAVAVDRRNILIVVGSGSHVRTYNALTGAYMDTLDQGWGDGNFQFRDNWGVATDSSNFIYVSDRENNRVMVYSYNPTSTTQKFKFIRQVGAGGSCNNANDSFCGPRGIFVDALKNLYVADFDNCRVQVFNSLGVYKKTFGNGMCGDSFARLGGPDDVAVDALGRVYVSEEWNQRVNVFDKTGAYLSTIGGNWGEQTGTMRNPRSVAVDRLGSVYVADQTNSRVQKFASSVPYWTQVNINGFGNRRINSIWTLGTFKGIMYAGGSNEYGTASIWKRVGANWVPVMYDGFEDGANLGIDHLLEYKGYLYATTANCTNQDCSTSNGGQLWRSTNGLDWQVVVQNGFNNPDNAELFRLAVLAGKLCVSTWSNGSSGSEIWCSATGAIGTWTREVENGFGVDGNKVILSMVDYKSPAPTYITASYATTLNAYGYAHVWRKVAGSTEWQPLWPTWTDDGRYAAATGLSVYKNYLYVVVRSFHVDGLDDLGATIYRCQKCDGSDWSKALPDAMENPASSRGYGMEATPYGLYAFFGNMDDGLDILMSKDGVTWTRPFPAGLGSSNTVITYWDNANLWYGGALYLGTFNFTNGAGVWKHCPLAKVCK